MMGSGYERPIGANTHEATQVFKSSSQAVLAARDKNHRESDFLEGAKRVLKYMQNLWQNNRLCDVVLECHGGNLHAHRVALGAYSEKLSNSFVDYPVTELLTINVKEFSKAAVHVILVFIYTTELNVTDGTVGEVLNCASELEIIYVKNNCIAYLNDNIKVSTVFVFMEIAARHHLIELQKRLDVFLTERFGEIINTDGFLNIAGDRLMRLLTEHKVSRQVGELAVFLAVVRWVEYRRSERAPLFPTLMKLVNLHLISPQDLINHVEKVGLVTETMESFQILYSAMALHAVKANGADVFVMSNNRVFHDTTSPNWTTTYPGAPYLGYQAKSEMAHHSSQPPPPPAASEVHPFGQKSPRAPLQRTITTVSQAQSVSAPPPSPRVQFNEAAPAVQLTQGQTSGFTMIPRTRQTQPQSQPQSQPPSQAQAQSNEHHEHLQGGMPSRMGNNPTYTSVAHFRPGEQTDAPPVGGGMLVVVAVGGVELETANPSIPGRCVYQYNPGQQGSSWTSLTSLPHNTHHHGVALLNNKLYVIGGSIYNPNGAGHLGDAISNVNVFDIRTRSWSEASSMIWRRTYLSVAADNDCIYAMGGEDENRNRLDSVERYDPRYNRWTHITNMPSGAKVGHSCAVYNSKLYVVGGYNSRRGSYPVMDNVECFDLNSNQWIIKRNLPQPRCHASLVVAMGSMYLIGGRTKSPGYAVSSMASILRYDELTDVWQHVANMHIPRHDAGCAAIGSAIYVVAGIRSPSPTCLAAVECYDCASGQWRHPVPNLPYTAAGLSCCAVRL